MVLLLDFGLLLAVITKPAGSFWSGTISPNLLSRLNCDGCVRGLYNVVSDEL